jgi:hypothetical protein
VVTGPKYPLQAITLLHITSPRSWIDPDPRNTGRDADVDRKATFVRSEIRSLWSKVKFHAKTQKAGEGRKDYSPLAPFPAFASWRETYWKNFDHSHRMV